MALTRAEMEQVIKEGGSILYGGQIITNLAHLPSEAALAKGDPAKEQIAASDLQAQITQLQEQLASITAAQPPASTDDTPPVVTPPTDNAPPSTTTDDTADFKTKRK